MHAWWNASDGRMNVSVDEWLNDCIEGCLSNEIVIEKCYI